MQSFFQREEDYSLLPPTHYPRAQPLAEGEHRERDPDPQLLWNGMRITLTAAQRQQLAETGEIASRKKSTRRRSSGSEAAGRHRWAGEDRRARPVRRFQWRAARRGGRVLPAPGALVEPDDPRRQPGGDGGPRRGRAIEGDEGPPGLDADALSARRQLHRRACPTARGRGKGEAVARAAFRSHPHEF